MGNNGSTNHHRGGGGGGGIGAGHYNERLLVARKVRVGRVPDTRDGVGIGTNKFWTFLCVCGGRLLTRDPHCLPSFSLSTKPFQSPSSGTPTDPSDFN